MPGTRSSRARAALALLGPVALVLAGCANASAGGPAPGPAGAASPSAFAPPTAADPASGTSGPAPNPSDLASGASSPAAITVSPQSVGSAGRTAPRAETVLALGDSVPAGMACGCTPYVSLIAEQMTHSTGIRVTAVNDAVSGSNSTGLLASLRAASTTASDAARADVVIVTIGANDFTVPSAGAASCVTATSCYQTGLMTLDANITATIAQLRALRQARQLPPATIVVTGYWNVWQDGAVAAQMGSDFVRLSRAITSATNDVLSQAARAQGVWYVDLVRPFLGADEDDDDTSLLAPDGDHPDAEGHQLIATAILQAVPSLLQRPQ